MKHEIILRGETLCLAVCNADLRFKISKLPKEVDLEGLEEYVESKWAVCQVPFMKEAELEIDGEVRDLDYVDVVFEERHFRWQCEIIQPFYAWWLKSKPSDEWKWEVEDDDFDPKQFKIKIISNEITEARGGIILWEVSYRGTRLDPVGPYEKYLHEECGNKPRLTRFKLNKG